MLDERGLLRRRAGIVIAAGLWLCLAGCAAVIVPRMLGLIGNAYVSAPDGGYLWVGFRGAVWVLVGAASLLVGLTVLAAGVVAHRRWRVAPFVLTGDPCMKATSPAKAWSRPGRARTPSAGSSW